MKSSIRLEFDDIRSLDFSLILAGTYTGIGTSLSYPARMIKLSNFTDALLMFSTNGVDDKFVLGAMTDFILDITANKTSDSGLYLGAGDKLYVKQEDIPLSGKVYLSVLYGSED